MAANVAVLLAAALVQAGPATLKSAERKTHIRLKQRMEIQRTYEWSTLIRHLCSLSYRHAVQPVS